MAAFNKFDSFIEALAEKKHDLSADVLMIALCDAANPPTNSFDSVLVDLTQISYANLPARTLTVSSSAQTAGTYRLIVNDFIITAVGGSVGPFQYVAIYNDTALNKELICWFDIGTPVTLADTETLTLDFNNTSGLFAIA